jgi:putative addiction module component (TIGR02574 family)
MVPETEDLIEKVLKLPLAERANLAVRLLESLDDENDDTPAEVEATWREEIARRYEDMLSGRDAGVPAEQVLDEMRRAIDEEGAHRQS